VGRREKFKGEGRLEPKILGNPAIEYKNASMYMTLVY
jgi:hypothetical protein